LERDGILSPEASPSDTAASLAPAFGKSMAWTSIGVVAIVPPMEDIRSVIESFTKRLKAVIEYSVFERARANVLAAFGDAKSSANRSGELSKVLVAAARRVPVKARKKAPVQLCPVPGCKNRAAPIFGMVCTEHKNLPKAKIRKYREARRLAKVKGTGSAAPQKHRAKSVGRKAKPAVRKPKRVARKARPVTRRVKRVARPKKQARQTAKAPKAVAEPAAVSTPTSPAASAP
jgi:hypothetical protein